MKKDNLFFGLCGLFWWAMKKPLLFVLSLVGLFVFVAVFNGSLVLFLALSCNVYHEITGSNYRLIPVILGTVAWVAFCSLTMKHVLALFEYIETRFR